MGLIANYQYISDNNLKTLKNLDLDEFFEYTETLSETEEILLDIDKMWDVLHFVLTGVEISESLEKNPLSEAIVGTSCLEDTEEFISFIEKDKIENIVLALDNFDMQAALEHFSMEKCKKAELYPNIWDYDDEVEEIKEEIADHFHHMKEFYQKILKANGNVLITIY